MVDSSPSELEVARDIALAMLAQTGIGAWKDANAATLNRIGISAAYLTVLLKTNLGLPGTNDMAITAVFRTQSGTAKTLASSGGTVAITLTSLGNGSMRQAATLDLGETRAALYRLDVAYELAATPTAGNAINHFVAWSDSSGASQANTSGSDAAYSGYSSNAAASVKELDFLGAHICTAQATSTVQKSFVGVFSPKGRYLNLVVDNESGAAFHSSATNCIITLTPIEDTSEPS
jgi:hypothetical protein